MKNSSKWALLQALWSDGVHHPLPAFITLDVTPRCNLTCIGCRFHSPILKHHHTGRETTTDMPLALVQRLLQDRAALSSTQIFVEGSGEPFMHPHIIEMLTLLKKAQFKLTIFTNGTLLDSELVKKLIEIKVTSSVSVFSPQAQVPLNKIMPGLI